MSASATAVFGTLNTGSGTSPTVTIGPVAAGVTLVVVGYWHDPSGTTYTPSCSDTVNGSYGTKILDIYDSTNQQRMVAFKFLGSASGSPTATVSIATAEYAAAMAFVVTGSDGAAPTTIGQTQTATTATDNLTSTTLTPTSQPGLLLGLAAITGTVGTGPAAGTGFTSLGTGWVDGGAIARAESKTFSSTSAVAATFTAGTATQHHAIALAFYDTGGPGPAAPTRGQPMFFAGFP